MSGLGGLNKSPNGVGIGLVQLQLPVVLTAADLQAQTRRICERVAKARRNQPGMDLVVFPEYSLHGLSMDTNETNNSSSPPTLWEAPLAPRTLGLKQRAPHAHPSDRNVAPAAGRQASFHSRRRG